MRKLYKKSTLVYGVGINNADYPVQPVVNGKQVFCPFYRKWQNMLERCYSTNYQATRPTYIGCSVSEEWLTFSVFKAWMEKQYWEDGQLDKDLLIEGNKKYSPDTCVFVSSETNSLLTDRGRARGELPLGVSKNRKGYLAKCRNSGKQVYLGIYNTPEQASSAYLAYKSKVIIEHASGLTDARVIDGLVRIANRMAIEAEKITNP